MDEVVKLDGFSFGDLFDPARLDVLYSKFQQWFIERAPVDHAAFERYKSTRGEGMTPLEISNAILSGAPHVGRFLAEVFGLEGQTEQLKNEIGERDPLWRFKREFAKKRVLRDSAGKAWFAHGLGDPEAAARAVLKSAGMEDKPLDEEMAVAKATLSLHEVDDIARKVKKGGGAEWSPELKARAAEIANAAREAGVSGATDEDLVAAGLDAVEAWLGQRLRNKKDAASHWPSLHAPHTLKFEELVQLRRPSPEFPELFVGPDEHRRNRSFALTDHRASAREVEQEIDYCMLCHERDKDSCSKGFVEKTGGFKKNPLGVPLEGCPLEEKISEMHTMRGKGEVLAALAIVMIDNPMCPGTGHRICNDCMKACIFQKQEPVNIPQIETRVLTEVLSLPYGVEIYGLLTRFNPLNVSRPVARPYNGKNALVVGLGPAGYTLAHHLASDGFAVVAVDGLKLEPLDAAMIGSEDVAPRPIKAFSELISDLDTRILLGFGGVSEYGITVRWDKNFLTLAYLTLSRNRNLKMFGGVRFGGTITLDDAWSMGFDHVALAAGAGKPTLIDIKNNLARGIRKASDFLMGLQLTGAYKKSSIANLQVRLPAVVIGGGLTAIDTATELLAYYVVQIEKTAERVRVLEETIGEEATWKRFDDEEKIVLIEHLAHAKELAAERILAAKEGRDPRIQDLLSSWGGVSLAYRKSLQDSPAYRLNHEEVAKSLEEGVRYIENVSPVEAVLDPTGAVKAIKMVRKDGSELELPARTICVAAGTSPNITYEREYEGTFVLDERKQYFRAHNAKVSPTGDIELVQAEKGDKNAFFTSYQKGQHIVSFYGDNHPVYAGSVVRAMASAKVGHEHVLSLFPDVASLGAETQPGRDALRRALFAKVRCELVAEVVSVNRLTETIVEVVVHAPIAARKFLPGQFYRLQNFETLAPIVEGQRLAMEGLALTGAWVDPEKGLLGTIVLEMGGSSRLCAALKPGEPVILMGPTGAPTEIEGGELVLLAGGGLGNAVLFSIARAFKALGSQVLYFAGYKRGEDLFKQDDIERFTDQVIWTTDTGVEIAPHREGDVHFRGNIVQAMLAYAKGDLGEKKFDLRKVDRIIAIGSDRMMQAVQMARQNILKPYLQKHRAIGSINSPMQCMMKEVCAQCLQKHRDPVTGKETVIFSCFNQDQDLDFVDFAHLRERLRLNSMQEKLTDAWLAELLKRNPDVIRV